MLFEMAVNYDYSGKNVCNGFSFMRYYQNLGY